MADIDNDKVNDIEIGIVGSGSMGGGMTLLFSQNGSRIGCYDYDKDAVRKLMDEAKEDENVDEKLVHGFTSLEKMMKAFPKGSGDKKQPRIVVLSMPHGKPVDGIQKDLLPLLDEGDIVIDGGNEWWEETERRQAIAKEKGIEWVGMGVSGGYQSARHGPSMSPGCTKEAWEFLKPYLEKWAAKTPEGEPCVMHIGPGGSGHYVKMIHNGIEHAHLSILCEVRALLHYQLGLSNDEIANLFESWWKSGPLRGNFLVGIGFKGLRFKEGGGIEHAKDGIVEKIEDKVTQDVDLSEGTGTWSAKEIAERHVAAPAIAAAHQLRIISSDKFERIKVADNLNLPQPSKAKEAKLDEAEKGKLLETVQTAVYGAILGAFIQGLDIITKASQDQRWNISLATCIKIWRQGCIIQSDAIAEFLLPLFEKFPPSEPINLLKSIPEIAKELAKTYDAQKKLYSIAIETDAVAPALGASLEYIKAINCRDLDTNFMELELDYFGHHNYDIKGKTEKGHEKGKYHTEFAKMPGV
ncbi:6-phosphogluconate dehydrogenase (decarboxylating) [Kwoniella bestiolae CBS 10118]|uniref:6-phosphogluconate dehydrogenase, decarboxylating n=1 Tax=Kwoniella bestiolae CBS 10118 TaxID=1296100 RepID=A0A1B9GBC9_9TREE|nr:6-phosphogluconate dehydrogenase (decarboxylating) [Kwoniella bestiolae CBS 10118]OCF28320.1 6-phosphogluconate dehydrogenase (decarboxylating) [Kwoniella bestiolae CBS 10118]